MFNYFKNLILSLLKIHIKISNNKKHLKWYCDDSRHLLFFFRFDFEICMHHVLVCILCACNLHQIKNKKWKNMQRWWKCGKLKENSLKHLIRALYIYIYASLSYSIVIIMPRRYKFQCEQSRSFTLYIERDFFIIKNFDYTYFFSFISPSTTFNISNHPF